MNDKGRQLESILALLDTGYGGNIMLLRNDRYNKLYMCTDGRYCLADSLDEARLLLNATYVFKLYECYGGESFEA